MPEEHFWVTHKVITERGEYVVHAVLHSHADARAYMIAAIEEDCRYYGIDPEGCEVTEDGVRVGNHRAVIISSVELAYTEDQMREMDLLSDDTIQLNPKIWGNLFEQGELDGLL